VFETLRGDQQKRNHHPHKRAEGQSRMMLKPGENRVLDVAVACGFKRQEHFAHVFRSVCRASPTEYRREFAHFLLLSPTLKPKKVIKDNSG
jgi:AraC-like DNA-binding protein